MWKLLRNSKTNWKPFHERNTAFNINAVHCVHLCEHHFFRIKFCCPVLDSDEYKNTYWCCDLFYCDVVSKAIIFWRSRLPKFEFTNFWHSEEHVLLNVSVVKSALWWSPDPQVIVVAVIVVLRTRKTPPDLKVMKRVWPTNSPGLSFWLWNIIVPV